MLKTTRRRKKSSQQTIPPRYDHILGSFAANLIIYIVPILVEQRVVELNFALGDFDESKIALLEELGKEDSGDEDDDKEDDEN